MLTGQRKKKTNKQTNGSVYRVAAQLKIHLHGWAFGAVLAIS